MKQWFLMEEIENSHPFLSIDAKICCVDIYHYGLPKGLVTETVIKGEGDTDQLCFRREEFSAVSLAVFNKIVSDLNWALQLSRSIITASAELRILSEKIKNTDVATLSDSELGKLIETWVEKRRETHGLGMPWNYVEYEDHLFSRHITEYIAKQIKQQKLDFSPAQIFATLAAPPQQVFSQKEELKIIKLAILEKRGQTNFTNQFNQHVQEYAWLPYMYLGPAWSAANFEFRLKELHSKSLAELEELQAKKELYSEKLAQEQNTIMERLNFDGLHRRYVELAQSFIYTKAERKDAIYHGFYCLEKTFKESAKRLGLSLKQFRMLMSWEVGEALRSGKIDVNELNQRYQYRVFHYDGSRKIILSGDAARKFFSNLKFESTTTIDVAEIKGDCACAGVASGNVKIINTPAEMAKMQPGDILVSRATSPDIVAAMKQAAAIVTDMGGITCHAAIVSRELGIPCVIGTKIATKVLKDGDMVEINATTGVVKKYV